MKKIVLLINYFFFVTFLFTQPLPCLPADGGIPAGNEAPGCFLCGPIYKGSTEGYTPSLPFSEGFPCGTIENNQFFSFISDSTGSVFADILNVRNCVTGIGIELMFFDRFFNPVSNCFFLPGHFSNVVRADNLIPGEVYWIMIDGWNGNICDFTLEINGGIHFGPPDSPSELAPRPDSSPLCPGSVVCYSIAPVKYALEYEWKIPSNARLISGGEVNDTLVCVEYIGIGGEEVRVTPKNACFPGVPAILPVEVIQNSHFQATVIDTLICEGDCIQIGDSCYNKTISQIIYLDGSYSQSNGCDSSVLLKLTVIDSTNTLAVRCENLDDEIKLSWDNDFVFDEYTYFLNDSSGQTISDNFIILKKTDLPSLFNFEIMPEANHTGCSISKTSIQIDLNNWPTTSFLSPDTVCITDEAIFRIPNQLVNSDELIWNSTGDLKRLNDTIYSISWSSEGIKEVSLQAVIDGCLSDPFTKQLIVLEQIEAPVISCIEDPGSIRFEWNRPFGVDSFIVVTGFLNKTTIAENHYTLNNLPPDRKVFIRVIPISSTSCKYSFSQIECMTSETTDIPEVSENNSLKIIPNPTTGTASIISDLLIKNIEVFDLSGRKIIETEMKVTDLFGFPSGIYFFKIKTRDKVFLKKVIKI